MGSSDLLPFIKQQCLRHEDPNRGARIAAGRMAAYVAVGWTVASTLVRMSHLAGLKTYGVCS